MKPILPYQIPMLLRRRFDAGPIRIEASPEAVEYLRDCLKEEDHIPADQMRPIFTESNSGRLVIRIEQIPYRKHDINSNLVLPYIIKEVEIGRVSVLNPDWSLAPLEAAIGYGEDGIQWLWYERSKLKSNG